MNTLPREALKVMKARKNARRHLLAKRYYLHRHSKWLRANRRWTRRFEQLINRTLENSEIPGALTTVG
jgi:hypothetical protein